MTLQFAARAPLECGSLLPLYPLGEASLLAARVADFACREGVRASSRTKKRRQAAALQTEAFGLSSSPLQKIYISLVPVG
jgi:hypothetical protein